MAEDYWQVRARVDAFAEAHPIGHRLVRRGLKNQWLRCVDCCEAIHAPVLPRPAETDPMVLSLSRFD
jgi:hypothetical protein